MIVPPAARAAVAAVAAATTEPIVLALIGGVGTGKTTALSAMREALRGGGVTVSPRPARLDEQPGRAVVVDDAHLLDDESLERLTAVVLDGGCTVLIAAEPLNHRPALTTLLTAMQREAPAVALAALSPAQIAEAGAAMLGTEPAPETVRSLAAATAGLPFLITAALGEPGTDASALTDRADHALLDRLRGYDDALLDAMLMLSVTDDLGATDVAAALPASPAAARALVDRVRATGLLDARHGPEFAQRMHRLVARTVGAGRHHQVETALLATQLDASSLSAELALRLAEHGLADARLAATLAELASRPGNPAARAARLLRAAHQAGATTVSAPLADALAASGDCPAAARLAEQLLTSADETERAAAVRIGAAVAAHDGVTAQAADLYRWLGPHSDAVVAVGGAVAGLAVGDPELARAALAAPARALPTSAARSARCLADGMLASLDRPYPAVMSRLGQALGTESPTPAGLDSPAALVTLAAVHGGDTGRARSVISRAVRDGEGGGPESDAADSDNALFSHRHRLLQGWIRMQDGQLRAAGAEVRAVLSASGGRLHRRDALWAAALQTGIARRAGDSGGVHTHWHAGIEVLAEYTVDVFSLLPLGELWVAAALLRRRDQVEHTVAEAFALLENLGGPVLWSVPLHWAGVHAGILANSPESIAPYGQALTAAAGSSSFAQALAGAGRTWLRVLAQRVDTDEVTAAANALSRFGLTWDATRLASQAALHSPDARVSSAMLQLARDLKHSIAADETAISEGRAAAAAPTATAAGPAAPTLSEREREVAELLLLGRPYRDIGAQLLISAKTVEHHVARIRRRLGAESRSEMLSMLRALLDSPPPGPGTA
ncbi:MAG: isoniazid response ATPase/transcriptional regulator IniR [Actinomycetota bacterium]|nr:isoniazid response ATPase/transcriptional regulator IniR [Actinomycetota bacterium]